MVPTPRLKLSKININNDTTTNNNEESIFFSPRGNAASVIYQDELFIHGGILSNDSSQALLNDFWYYNFITKFFQQVKISSQQKPCPRCGHSIVVSEKSKVIYLFAGGDTRLDNLYFNDLWKFDLQKKKWIQINQRNRISPRTNFALFMYNEKMYIYGGRTLNGTILNDIHVFDFKQHQWIEIQTKNDIAPRCNFAWVINQDYLYVHGGEVDQDDFDNNIIDTENDFVRLKLDTFVWEEKTSVGIHPPSSYQLHGHSAVVNNNILYIMYDNTSSSNNDDDDDNHKKKNSNMDVFAYDFNSQRWSNVVVEHNNEINSCCAPNTNNNGGNVINSFVTQVYDGDIYVFSASTGCNETVYDGLYRLRIMIPTFPTLVSHHQCLGSDFHSLINNQDEADICFIVGDNNEKIYAHKCILSARSSECFKKQFLMTTTTTPTRETSYGKPFVNEIKIDNNNCISCCTFIKIIEYLYTGNIVTMNMDIAIDVLIVSEQYELYYLMTFCAEVLYNEIMSSSIIITTTKLTIIELILTNRKKLSKLDKLKESTIEFLIQYWKERDKK